jgi:hypothetical protein
MMMKKTSPTTEPQDAGIVRLNTPLIGHVYFSS